MKYLALLLLMLSTQALAGNEPLSSPISTDNQITDLNSVTMTTDPEMDKLVRKAVKMESNPDYVAGFCDSQRVIENQQKRWAEKNGYVGGLFESTSIEFQSGTVHATFHCGSQKP
jgi:hypothetical protein